MENPSNTAGVERTSMTYEQLRERRPPWGTSSTVCLRWLTSFFDEGTVVVPEYQRGHVWTREQASAFVGHWLEGGTVPPIYIQRWADPDRSEDLVDGLQRVTALRDFNDGTIPAVLHDGISFYLQQMDAGDQRRIRSHSGPTISIVYVTLPTLADVLSFYIRINQGVAHAPEELARVAELLRAEVAK